jgi:hypothetical protein
MPALSPTMTEGNIASWKVKEGDSFSAGDVLLEIETDKASMDVEAQDDGIMAKITLGDGSKGIQVGTRIGVLAEPGDDLSTLEIPAEESAPSPKEEASKPEPASTSESQAEAPPTSKPSNDTPAKSGSGKSAPKQTKPLLPSVEHLIHTSGLSASDIDKMTPTGPKNRLLKGDVLAYIGSISANYPTELSDKINKLSHLDLSNIKLAAPKPAPAPAKSEKAAPAAPAISDVALTISMTEVIAVQKRIQSTLGVYMPLSTFIARATDLANDDLPRSKTAAPTANELFDSILGLSSIPTTARGTFLPQITALPATNLSAAPPAPKVDIIDLLASKKSVGLSKSGKKLVGMVPSVNVFSVTVPKGDEKRAKVFLQRVKDVLESQPGSLVL